MLYPITIVLVLLNLGNGIFKRDPKIYRPAMTFTTIFAIIDSLRTLGLTSEGLNTMLSQYIPLYSIGFGWVAPCIAGILVGFVWKALTSK